MKNSIVAQIRHTQGDFKLDVELKIPAKGITGLYGHSGSGKSTLLRCVAGLERPESGFLTIGEEVWQDKYCFLPAHKRAVGMVFQDIRLFPHMNVRDNLFYGFKRRSSLNHAVKPDEIISLLKIDSFLGRKPNSLSGGEAQRVAIARALMSSPKLLLMDEPMAAVDAEAKDEFMSFLVRLHQETDIPIIMVSHHIRELIRVSDHLMLMKSGQIKACGPIEEVLSLPDLSEAHGFEAGALLNSSIREYDEKYDLTCLDSQAGILLVPGFVGEAGGKVRLRLLAQDISLSLNPPDDSSVLNVLSAVITGFGDSASSQIDVCLEVNGVPILSRITRKSCEQLKLISGQRVFAQIKSVAIEK